MFNTFYIQSIHILLQFLILIFNKKNEFLQEKGIISINFFKIEKYNINEFLQEENTFYIDIALVHHNRIATFPCHFRHNKDSDTLA